MLQDKRGDLDAEKRKKILDRMVRDLSAGHPDLYYQPTSQIAGYLMGHIDKGTDLIKDERDLLSGLSQRDIEVLLSLN